MVGLEELAANEQVQKEYKKALLLNVFKKLCVRMEKTTHLKEQIKTIYLQSFNKTETTRLIIEREFDFSLNQEESSLMLLWITAYFQKNNARKMITRELKESLYLKQNGKCNSCGEDLGLNWRKIHVDHLKYILQ